MATGTHTQTTLDAALITRFQRETAILEDGDKVAMATPLVMDKKFDKTTAGVTHQWRVIPAGSTADISPTAGTFNDQADTETKISLTINKFKAYSIVLLGSIDQALSDYDLMGDYRAVGAQAQAEAMDTDVLSEGASSTLTDAGSVDREIQFGDFLTGFQTLLDNGAKLGPNSGFTAIVTPRAFTSMASLPQFNDASIRGEGKSVLSTGLGPNGKAYFKPLGADLYVSSNLPANGAGKSCLLGVKGALIIARSKTPKMGAANMLGSSTGVDANRFYNIRYYGVKIRLTTRILEIATIS